MKLVTAVIKPFLLDDVRAALEDLGVVGLTVSDAQGYGRQRGKHEIYDGSEKPAGFLPRVRLEAVVDPAVADAAVGAIYEAASTGLPGDGRVWVTEVESFGRLGKLRD